jgi:hypothetical protein
MNSPRSLGNLSGSGEASGSRCATGSHFFPVVTLNAGRNPCFYLCYLKGQTAIQSARKDLGDYVSQAQKGLNKQLSTTFSAAPTSDTDAQPSTASSSRDIIDLTTADNESLASSSTSASTATLADPQQQQQQQQERQRPDQAQSPNAQTLFTRLQSTIPPDLFTSIRETIPDSVRDAQARRELAQVAQARVQGAAARGEELLRGASVFLRDAVRVVPPGEAASSTPAEAHEGTAEPRGQATPPPVGVASAPATRRGALLRALREYPSILRVDPASEERSAALFALWVEAVGAEASRDESHREAELGAEDGMLRGTHSALGECPPFGSVGWCFDESFSWGCLVPGELTEEEFWTRYFFRVHQIDQEEERRKAVLAGKVLSIYPSSRLLTHDDFSSWSRGPR